MEGKKQITPAHAKSRRKFMQRAGTGAVLASLPMKSVWANGITNSIVASGHGSDWADGEPLALGSHGYWKNHISPSDASLTFESIFMTRLKDDSGNDIKIEESASTAEIKPTLGQILWAAGDKCAVIPDAKSTLTAFDGSSMPNPAYKANKGGFDLSGAGNVNVHLVAMYLNALYGQTLGGDVYYPIVGTTQFPTMNDYITYLMNKYTSTEYFTMGSDLNSIIQDYGR